MPSTHVTTAQGKVRIRPVQSPAELAAAWAFLDCEFRFSAQHPRGPAFYQERCRETPGLLLVAELDGQLRGALLGHVEGDHILIGEMGVDAACRGQGVGSALLAELEAQARSIGQHRILLGALEAAEQFYLRNGYQPLLFVQAASAHAARLAELIRGQKAGWREDGEQWSKAILDTPVIDKALQHELERQLPGCHTQYLFIKNLTAEEE